ncbi:MAG TPA: DUF5916 domain-containing protein, partial [Gemmatimonadaceae bacterium]|nr:DUF5916 domain-containing protein [Gemmatimonadaceae bacterium]
MIRHAAWAIPATVLATGIGHEAPSLRATATASEIRIDGRIDEPAWSTADSSSGFAQVEPNEGSTPSARTLVRALVTKDAIVFAILCEYAPGVNVVTFARERDAALSNEDHVRLVIDTFRDGRSGYVFALNAHGARYDALVSENGDGENSNWDAAWEAATARTASGWSAEIRIPIKSLLFDPRLDAWGFNVERRIQARQETDRWANASQDFKVTQMSRAGLLTGLPRFSLGLGTSVRPALTAGGAHDSATAPFRDRSHASLDVTQRVGANTLASLTANTDFAETEVDARRVNLSRFPLFFPEKRAFFLEGADVFDFGLGLDEDVIPFFSRRIGLIEGEQVPINAGGKLNGRVGGLNFGALAVNTRAVDTLRSASTMGVIRLRQNVLEESSIGVIATAGDPLGRAGGWLAGPDFTYHTSHFRGDKNFLVGVWGLGAGHAD